jgi:hypothetical protein
MPGFGKRILKQLWRIVGNPRRLREVSPQRELRLSGELQAVLIAGGTTATSDHVHVGDGFTATVTRGQVVPSVRVTDSGAHSISADVAEADDVIVLLSGPPSVGESNVQRACVVLVEYLRQNGEKWANPRVIARSDSNRETGVDCIVEGPAGTSLQIQVVRADLSPRLWECLSTVGRLQGRYDPGEIAGALRTAIDHKAKRTARAQRETLTLVLDATLIASHAMQPGVENFRRLSHEWAAGLGFSSIWIVGPVAQLVWRLDKDPLLER